MSQARFTDPQSARDYWDQSLDRFGESKDWTATQLANHRALAEAIYLLWGASGGMGVLAAIKAGVGVRFWVGEWLEEMDIAACWGFYGDLARYYEVAGKAMQGPPGYPLGSADLETVKQYQSLARFAASCAESSANALERARAGQWDALFLEYGGETLSDLNDILEWANTKIPGLPDDIPQFKIGLGLGAAAVIALLWYLR